MRNIQLKMTSKIRQFEKSMNEMSTFAKGSDINESVKAYKLYIRIVDAGIKYDISVRMRNQLKVDTGYLVSMQLRTGNGGTRTFNKLR